MSQDFALQFFRELEEGKSRVLSDYRSLHLARFRHLEPLVPDLFGREEHEIQTRRKSCFLPYTFRNCQKLSSRISLGNRRF